MYRPHASTPPRASSDAAPSSAIKKKIKDDIKKKIAIDVTKCIAITTKKEQCTKDPKDGASYCKRHATIVENAKNAALAKVSKKMIAEAEETILMMRLELEAEAEKGRDEEAKTRLLTRELEDRKLSEMMDLLGSFDMTSSMSQ
ncbi:hypothetical protein T492DRAFT_1149877 [Pavlovales sp. CCMP2436]|nr:hypothetical protein T492DRAFT_1149877 [Pavlovales sp. CCMP2436]